jgi:hypothetical protein
LIGYVPNTLYRSEFWAMKKKLMNVAEMRILRSMSGVVIMHKIKIKSTEQV